MTNILNDVSVLTTIPEKTLSKLNEKVIYCINEAVAEAVADGKEITELDLGIGTLLIKNDADCPKYKFIPSEILQMTVTSTVNNKLNLLEDVLCESLKNRIINVYKDIC